MKGLSFHSGNSVGIVQRVSDQRMSDRRHVYPDLMGTSRFQMQLHISKSSALPERPKMSDGSFSVLRINTALNERI